MQQAISIRQFGFTLFEILIALFIFAILGVMSAITLHGVIGTHARVSQVDDQTQNFETSMTLMRRDFSQIIDRSILDEDGNRQSAVSATPQGIDFTRAGFVNPLQLQPRSTLQRVAYQLQGSNVVRITWPVLDRVRQTKSQQQVILRHVSQLQIRLLTDDNQLIHTWPVSNPYGDSSVQPNDPNSDLNELDGNKKAKTNHDEDTGADPSTKQSQRPVDLPKAIRLDIDFKSQGRLLLFFAVPARGVSNALQG